MDAKNSAVDDIGWSRKDLTAIVSLESIVGAARRCESARGCAGQRDLPPGQTRASTRARSALRWGASYPPPLRAGREPCGRAVRVPSSRVLCVSEAARAPPLSSTFVLKTGGGGGNRTRVLQSFGGASPSAAGVGSRALRRYRQKVEGPSQLRCPLRPADAAIG